MAGGSAQPDGHGRLRDISVKKAGFRLSMVPPGHPCPGTHVARPSGPHSFLGALKWQAEDLRLLSLSCSDDLGPTPHLPFYPNKWPWLFV